MRTKAVKKTRAQWAEQIRAAHKASVEGILKIGRMLTAAKRALAHGEFTKMIERDLPFDASTAQRLMKVARDPRLRKAAQGQLLPAAWRTLYEITKLSDAEFAQAVRSGAINPQMKRRDVVTVMSGPERPLLDYAKLAALSKSTKVTDSTPINPHPAKTVIIAAPQHLTFVRPVAPDILRQIEQLVGELQAQVGRGEITLDAAFSARARSVADQLLTMVLPAEDVA